MPLFSCCFKCLVQAFQIMLPTNGGNTAFKKSELLIVCLTSSSAQSTKKASFFICCCIMPNSSSPVGKKLLIGEVHSESEGQSFRSMMDCGREREQEQLMVKPLNKKGGLQGHYTSYIIHTLMVFLILLCERRKLTVLRLSMQLSSRDREVWREANVRCLHEKMNALATILVSEE